MKPIWIATVLVTTVLGACNAGPMSVDPPYGPPCPADLRFQVDPSQVSLLPDETVQASYKVFGCGGTQELDVTPVWVSEDPSIATVSDTGLITAQPQGGNTEITVSEGEYDTEAMIQVNVAIVEPTP